MPSKRPFRGPRRGPFIRGRWKANGAVTDQPIYAAGIPSAEVSGAPAVNAEVDPAGLATAFALGSPAIAAQVVAAGVTPALAFGLPIISEAISVVGVDDLGQQFGTPGVGGEEDETGIPSAFFAGSPSLAASVAPAGVASSESFGAPTVGEPIIQPPPDGSGGGSGMFGMYRARFPLPLIRQKPPIPPLLPAHVIRAAGNPSAFASGEPVILAVISPAGIPSAAESGRPTIKLISSAIPAPERPTPLPPVPVSALLRRRKRGERQLLRLSLAFVDELDV